MDGVGGEGFEGAGDHGQLGVSVDDAQDDAGVFGFAGEPPAVHGLAIEVLQAIGRDMLGQVQVSRVRGLRLWREGLREPVADSLDDLANTGL